MASSSRVASGEEEEVAVVSSSVTFAVVDMEGNVGHALNTSVELGIGVVRDDVLFFLSAMILGRTALLATCTSSFVYDSYSTCCLGGGTEADASSKRSVMSSGRIIIIITTGRTAAAASCCIIGVVVIKSSSGGRRDS